MFAQLKSRTYFLFAGLNLLWIPIVYFFYPETMDRSLERIEAMFSSSSPFYKDMERAYRQEGDVLAVSRLENTERVGKGVRGDDEDSFEHSEKASVQV